jgi:hypothetical protein
MNMIKFALLGTAAIAAVSVSARATEASDIAALKAQVEALSAQVASNSAQTSAPAGFELVSVTTAPAIVVPGQLVDKNYATTATTIGVMPTADAPASTVVQWTGFVRAALTYYDGPFTNDTYSNVKARAELKVTGTTDTAVGEVGAWVKLRASTGWETGNTYQFGNSSLPNRPNRGTATVTSPGAWGWWKMTPELSLGGGMDGSIANNGYGYDGACSCNYTDNANSAWSHDGDPVQMRLTYASGPMTAAIALEDYENNGHSSTFGVAAKFNYAGDMFSAGLAGGYWTPADVGTAAWNINVGVKVGLSDMGFLSVSAGLGNDDHTASNQYWKANALASLNLSEQAHVELGINRISYDTDHAYNLYDSTYDYSQTALLAGLYYEPVKQLTIGLEGEYIKNDYYANNSISGDLVTVFRF